MVGQDHVIRSFQRLGDLIVIGNALFGLSDGRTLNGTFGRSFENRIGRSLKTSAECTLPFSEQVIFLHEAAPWVIVWIASATSSRHDIGKDIEAVVV